MITRVPTYVQNFNLKDIILAFTLLNYFGNPQNVINAIAWILVVELIFYIAVFSVLPVLRKNPRFSVLALLSFSSIIVALSRQFGANFFLFAVSVSYIPFLIMGQVAYYYYAKLLTKLEYALLSGITFICLVYGIMFVNVNFLSANNSYIISFLFAYPVFFIFLMLTDKISTGNILGFFAKISYSFYLNQAITLLFISILYPMIGYEASLIISLILLTSVAYLSWRFIEVPSRKISAMLYSKNRKPASGVIE